MSTHRRRSYRDFAEMSGFEIELPSSPDPLGDETVASMSAPAPPSTVRPPSTSRRLLNSTASSRFSALPGTSPRKRMFALDVGSEITPQTIYVTVEAGQDGIIPIAQGAGGPSVNRRLFGSPTPQPSPHHRIRTTTTTVPLRGLTDDESEATLKPPRRRRSSSARPGTPATATSAAKGRKARNLTPQKTKKQREARMPSSDILQSEISAKMGQPTPRRGPGRPPKRKRPEDAPSEQGGSELVENPCRGKRRRSLSLDEVATLSSNANEIPDELGVTGDARSKTPDPAQDSASRPATANDDNVREETPEAGIEEEEEEHDILMNDILNNVLSGRNQAAQGDGRDKDGLFSSAHAAAPDGSPSFFDDGDHLDGGSDGYGPIMEHDDRSDAESHTSADQMEAEHQSSEMEYQGPWPDESDNNVLISRKGSQNIARSSSGERSSRRGDDLDKTLDPESFTMIGIDSMPSLRQSRRLSPDPPELGEETSFFINKTLESLREEIAGSDDDDVDILVSRDPTPAETERYTRKTKAPSSDHQAHFTRSPAVGSSRRTPRSRRKTTSSTGSVVGKESMSESLPASARERLSDTDRWPEVNGIGDADDSFSDIPEEALAAAEAQEESRPSSIRAAEDLVAPESSLANEASHSVTQPSHGIGGESSNRPASSHSTPARGDRIGLNGNNDGSQRSVPRSTRSRRASGQQTLQNSSPPHSVRSRSDSNRLLTPPDETSSSSQSPASGAVAATEHAVDLVSDDIGSSPPEMTMPGENEPPVLPSRRNSDTPANRQPVTRAEQTQERPAFAIVPQPSHLGGQRPALSPVVRIGRTLQNILSDPPSPSARSSVLASPFKGSVRNSSPLDGAAVDEALQNVASADESRANSVQQSSSQNTIQQTARTWSMALAPLSQIKSLVSQGAQLFTSPHVNKPQSSDPFGPSSPSLSKRPDGTRNSSFLERIKQASHEGSACSSRVGSRDGIDDKDERHRTVRKANDSFNWRSGPSYSSLADRIGFSNRAQQPVGMATGLDGTHDTHVDEDIGGSQLGAARGPRQQSAENVRDAGVTVEEEEITEHIVQNDIRHSEQAEQSVSEDRMQSEDGLAPEEQSDEEDIWTIEANRTASSPRYPDLPDETMDSFRKSGLSIDWRTRSIGSLRNSQSTQNPSLKSGSNHVNTTENLEDYSLLDDHESTSPQAPAKKPAPQAQKQPKRVDLSGFFSSSPNFLERQQRAKQASLATATITMPVAGTTQIASPERTAIKVAEPVLRSSHSPSVSELPSPATNTSDKANQEPVSSTSFTVSQEHNSRNSIPRLSRQDFAPRHGENDAKLFENWAVSSQIASSEPASPGRDSPQKTTTRPPDTQPESEDEGSAVGTPPNLRPLPGRAASPSKSCLRSPLKPKQAGRVVDFTSSAISTTHPLQAQVGYENRSPIIPTSETLLPGMIYSGKENQNAMLNHTNDPSSPRHKRTLNIQQEQKHFDSPLSQTRWSRKHWLLLDELMQSYKRNPLEFQLRHSDAITATSPSKRPSSSLLGKQVTSQGKETLVLEQWHLDVTDTFKKEVGGWPEEMIAKRLFALIVGEERRRLGMVPKRR